MLSAAPDAVKGQPGSTLRTQPSVLQQSPASQPLPQQQQLQLTKPPKARSKASGLPPSGRHLPSKQAAPTGGGAAGGGAAAASAGSVATTPASRLPVPEAVAMLSVPLGLEPSLKAGVPWMYTVQQDKGSRQQLTAFAATSLDRIPYCCRTRPLLLPKWLNITVFPGRQADTWASHSSHCVRCRKPRTDVKVWSAQMKRANGMRMRKSKSLLNVEALCGLSNSRCCCST